MAAHRAIEQRLRAIEAARKDLAEEEAALRLQLSLAQAEAQVEDQAEALSSCSDGDDEVFPQVSRPSPPWTVGGGSVRWVLDELKLSSLYGPTFDEYGVISADQLAACGRVELQARLRTLGVTSDHRNRIERLVFSPRPCGANGAAYNQQFLAACRPLYAQHMGCENMGPLLYSLARFVKPSCCLEV